MFGSSPMAPTRLCMCSLLFPLLSWQSIHGMLSKPLQSRPLCSTALCAYNNHIPNFVKHVWSVGSNVIWSPPHIHNLADTLNAAICSGVLLLLLELWIADLVLRIGVNGHRLALSLHG